MSVSVPVGGGWRVVVTVTITSLDTELSVQGAVSVRVQDTVVMLRVQAPVLMLPEALDPDAELETVDVAKVEAPLAEGRMVLADPVMKPEGAATVEGVGYEGMLGMRDVSHDGIVGEAVVSQLVTSVSLAAGTQRS